MTVYNAEKRGQADMLIPPWPEERWPEFAKKEKKSQKLNHQ
jgi:hypothetical protein